MVRLGLVGLGKIARDQHLPAIAAAEGVVLAAVASPHHVADGVPSYPTLEAMLAAAPDLDAVVMCQPPQPRFAAALTALLAGKHVFLEKPPGVTVLEVQALAALAKEHSLTLFASWHSRCAGAVPQARAWLQARTLVSARVQWKEDVRHWHPGQDWIFEAGGFGVFDPAINALSILTAVARTPIRVREADLYVPANRQAPIAATLALETLAGAPIAVELDFLQTGTQTWDIAFETREGRMTLSQGGAALHIDGLAQACPPTREYAGLYRRFIDLVAAGESDVDLEPLQLVADAFLCGRLRPAAPFEP